MKKHATTVVTFDPKAAWIEYSITRGGNLLAGVVVEEYWSTSIACGRPRQAHVDVRRMRVNRFNTHSGVSFFTPSRAQRVEDLRTPAEIVFGRGR